MSSKLIRLENEIFGLNRVVYVQLDYDGEGGIALEFAGPVVRAEPYHLLDNLQQQLVGNDARRAKRFRFFHDEGARFFVWTFRNVPGQSMAPSAADFDPARHQALTARLATTLRTRAKERRELLDVV